MIRLIMRRTLLCMALCALLSAGVAASGLAPFSVERDAVPAPLAGLQGDPANGRAVLASRDGNCLLCHAVPETGERFMGNLAPPLSGVGARLSSGQLRLRIIDQSRLNPDTIMPSYYRVEGLHRVAESFRDKPVLTAQQIEDLVAYLGTLR